MKLHLVSVDATTLTAVGCGEWVIKGQELGMDPQRGVQALSPVDGVIRHIGQGSDPHSRVIHILSEDEEESPN